MSHEQIKIIEPTESYRSKKLTPTFDGKITSETKTTKSKKNFNSPCDKLYLQGDGNLDLTNFEKYRSPKPIGFIRGYRGHSSHRFCVFDADIFVYQNHYGYQIQLNPSQFRNYRLMQRTLYALLKEKFNSTKVFKLHLFTDIDQRLIEVSKIIRVSHKRRTTRYVPARREIIKSGTPKEYSFTLGFGTDNVDCIKVYNSSEKHGLPDPSTRIERQFGKAHTCPIKFLADFSKLQSYYPFANVQLNKIVDASKLTGVHLVRFKLLDCLKDKHGLHDAMAELRKDCPKHFVRDYRKVLQQLKKCEVDLITPYLQHWKRFYKSGLRDHEVEILRTLGYYDV